MRRRNWAGVLFLGIGLALVGVPAAHAVITALTPLQEQLGANEFICVAKVEKVLPEKPAAVLVVTEDLKGKLPFRRLPVNLTGDAYAKKHEHTPAILKRLGPQLPVILFATEVDNQFIVFGYTNGTWFQMLGQQPARKSDSLVLGFTHGEPFLRRTFKGSTAEMRQVIVDALAGKKKAPEPNAKEPPGFGPEVKADKGVQAPAHFLPIRAGRTAGPVFAVIPTLGIGGPLAILALLFPSLFGGVLVLFKRWTAFFTVVSVVSMVYLLYDWFALSLWGSWWASPSALWLTLTLTTGVGVLWAWRRHLSYSHQIQGFVPGLDRTELLVLGILSGSCLVVLIIYAVGMAGRTDPTFYLVLAFALGIWVATLYKLYRTLVLRAAFKPPLPTEGLILWTALCALITVAALQSGGQAVSSEVSTDSTGRQVAQLAAEKTWSFVAFSKSGGSIYSAPRVVGEGVYVSVAHKKGAFTYGAVYCLDRNTQKVLWSFNNGLRMKQVFSSPCVADGRVYIGEGFHDDADCKVYCLNADSGEKVWEFQTDSQTESTPCVAGGKVFCGGGNDGLYALDAANGKELWRFPGKSYQGRLIRIGAPAVVAGKRLYAGSAVDRNRQDDPGETAFFCLDTDSGELKWKVPTNLPVWGAAVVAGDRVFVPLGNGDIFSNASTPAGALLCLDAHDGRQVWRKDVANGVLERPAVDRHSVYFGCRDGRCYCLNRQNGSERWKKDLGSPVIAAPALDHDSTAGNTANVFVVARDGAVACLDPLTGKSHWTYHELERNGAHLSSAPTVVVELAPEGERRRIYFGAALNGLSIPALYCLEDVLPH